MEENNVNVNSEENKENQNPSFSDEQMALINKMIQSETDKVRTKYSKQMKDLQAKQSLSGLDEVERTKKELEMLRNE